MRLLSSLDAKDRRLLFWFLGVGIALAVLIGLLVPDGDANDNPLPRLTLRVSTEPAPRMRRCSVLITPLSAGNARSASWPLRPDPTRW